MTQKLTSTKKKINLYSHYELMYSSLQISFLFNTKTFRHLFQILLSIFLWESFHEVVVFVLYINTDRENVDKSVPFPPFLFSSFLFPSFQIRPSFLFPFLFLFPSLLLLPLLFSSISPSPWPLKINWCLYYHSANQPLWSSTS